MKKLSYKKYEGLSAPKYEFLSVLLQYKRRSFTKSEKMLHARHLPISLTTPLRIMRHFKNNFTPCIKVRRDEIDSLDVQKM